MGRLDGKVVVVTGASRGIGADDRPALRIRGRPRGLRRPHRPGRPAPPRGLAREHGRGHPRGGRRRPRRSPPTSPSPAECERLIARRARRYGPIDVLVNNAALTYYVPVKDYPVGKWLRSWAVNFHAPFILSQLVLADMIPRRSGAIVNISSGSAIGPGRGPYPDRRVGARGGTCYGAEKAALERFTQGLASEVYQYGVSVTCGLALAGRAHAGHRVPPPRQRARRPARRAADPDGAGRAAARHRAGRAGDRPRHLQPADPRASSAGSRPRAGAASTPAAAATRRSSGDVTPTAACGGSSWSARPARGNPPWPGGSPRAGRRARRARRALLGPGLDAGGAPPLPGAGRGRDGAAGAGGGRQLRRGTRPRVATRRHHRLARLSVSRSSWGGWPPARSAARSRARPSGTATASASRSTRWCGRSCSLLHWLFTTFWRYRRELPVLLREPAHAHARVVHLRSPRRAGAGSR